MENADPLLSELCGICHINPPKYRCPGCSARTCSLACSRRHKLWSQCSGVRDPAAYVRRNELASEAAFDRDFNFITGIERSLERAERDVENRGIELARGQAVDEGDSTQALGTGAGRKRKYPQQGLVKGEAGFLRGAEASGVRVFRAPRGMTRNKLNASRWHPKHKCLSWSVEWISAAGEKNIRNCLETVAISGAYDRAFPLPKEDRPSSDQEKNQKSTQQEGVSQDPPPSDAATDAGAAPTVSESADANAEPPSTTEPAELSTATEEQMPELPIHPHRGLYFYLHRPRTTTKKPVLVPLPPSAPLKAALQRRTVLEFPTIYLLPDSAETLLAEKETSAFIVEEEYLRTVGPEDAGERSAESEQEGTTEDDASGLPGSSVDLQNVDEKKVMEVLKQDLFESVP
ncbi:uncharacterized protein N7459_002934 [Penicillium hispanicum]|uniref:uncharacterized protein n=1 Tax=Penicillium hispanicum TaxID=1080232 RepID=UPI0025416717|nr:uncharacterized protein N7459_002934 [Penicillium hispanicum]KAJ5587169.1 hypothetical protein N7459_002934 [Penicillium hispanicum]